MNSNTTTDNQNIFRSALLAVIVIIVLAISVHPVSAELSVSFDWDVYKVTLADWANSDKYIEYTSSPVIYEVHFHDKSSSDAEITYRNWEFGNSDWVGSSQKDPIHIFTEEEADKENGRIKVTLSVGDSNDSFDFVSEYVYLIEDEWNLVPIHDLKPESTHVSTPAPTAAPTTLITTVPTTMPTVLETLATTTPTNQVTQTAQTQTQTQIQTQTTIPTTITTVIPTVIPTSTQTSIQTAVITQTTHQTITPTLTANVTPTATKAPHIPLHKIRIPLMSDILGALQGIYVGYLNLISSMFQ